MAVDKSDQSKNSESEFDELPTRPEPNDETPEEPAEKPEWSDLLGSGSVLKKIIKEGEPDSKPHRQQKCKLNITLSLPDDTTIETKENFEITVGDCEVVQGLDVAIGLMNVGERCILKIEPRLGFGALGLPPKIPPNSVVVYDVELVAVEDEDDPENMSISERKAQGNIKKERGNWWYGRGENTLAIQCYRRALDYLDEVEGGINLAAEKSEVSDAALQELLENRISVCNNMAAAQIKLELYEAALNSLGTVLRCQPKNVKALFRKAKVHRAKNDLNAALKALKLADEAAPNDPDVQKEISVINKLIAKQKESERELAKRMFGEQKSGAKNTKKHSKKNLLMWSATLAASFAVALVGVAAYRLKLS